MLDDKNPDSVLIKDFLNEDEFLKATKAFNFPTELQALEEAYKEQLTHFVRNRIDIDFFNFLILAEPNVKDHLDKKIQVERNAKYGRKRLEIMRKHIELAYQSQKKK